MTTPTPTSSTPSSSSGDGASTYNVPREVVTSFASPPAIGPYSQGIRAGHTMYVSGCIGADPQTGNLVAGGIEAQTEQVLKNMNEVLLAGGSSITDVLKCTVLLRSMSDFAAMNTVYAKHFPSAPPARSTFAVAGLPKDALVEIECIALVTREPSRAHIASNQPRFNPSAGGVNWETLYAGTKDIGKLPWFFDEADPDVMWALNEYKVVRGARLLDIGCGPGTQAREFAKAGYVSVGSDLSQTAIDAAMKYSEKERKAGLPLTFVVDNLLESKLEASSFDGVVDRGVLHVLPPPSRAAYSKAVASMLKPGGILIVISFSTAEPGTQGPHRFTKELHVSSLSNNFEVLFQKDSTYHGALQPPPKVIFSVFRRRTSAPV